MTINWGKWQKTMHLALDTKGNIMQKQERIGWPNSKFPTKEYYQRYEEKWVGIKQNEL